ncbi:FMN-binding protein [Paractinoplanes globisporus]|uniref:FMN-binding protein n=1 Tax=Paractinoplanes globisporus TaxID=113565 RepID=A0ABW6WYW4_9ACTN|nr:FMN-binding protein [Actinoplanes globisporus]
MRRITLWLFSTVAAVVLLFSYRTSTAGAGSSSPPAVATAPLAGDSGGGSGAGSDSGSGTGSGSGSGSGGDSGSGTGSGSGSSTSGAKTYTGSVAQTRWGPVQVSIVVSGGKITDVGVPTYPNNNNRDVEINAQALPILRQETLDRQSADIDAVSGATVTSDGYKESLQSALDAAQLK